MSPQTLKLDFILRSSIFDRPRQLVLDPFYLEFDDNNLASSDPTKFHKEEIAGIRFGIKRIKGLDFYIGRIYCIDIKNNSGKIISTVSVLRHCLAPLYRWYWLGNNC